MDTSMFADQAKIHIQSGNGGRGALSFRREKYVPLGGPDGGDGGRGADVYFVVDDQLATLTPFRYQVHYRAENGQPGRGRQMHGKSGEDLYISVPPGTTIYDDETGEPLADLVEPGESALVLKGGVGGAGNTRFKTSTNRAPRIAELGEPGQEKWVRLELKLIADVGLVGMPNAGKSTLLAASSAARPKIADYPFTTIEPNLGVVEVGGPGGDSFVMADIPGLIEGAAEGVGLGHEFLRHVERTRMFLHVLDGSGGLEERDPVKDYRAITEELESYSEEVASKPTFIVVNKMDIPEAQENFQRIKDELEDEVEEFVAISAVTGQGVPELMALISRRLAELPKARVEVTTAQTIYTLDDADPNYWEVEKLSQHHYEVRGDRIERTVRMTDFTLDQAGDRFQRILEASGISAELESLGIEPGDIVHIGDHELVWAQDILEVEEQLSARPQRRKTRRERLQEQFGPETADDAFDIYESEDFDISEPEE
jgi:GTPase